MLNSGLFLHTDKNQFFFGYRVINAEKHLHFDFKSVSVCYLNIVLGISSLFP